MLSNKTILVGITGGSAAYKICELIRRFKKNGANVKVVCTPNALNFVTKLTLQNLSQNEVYVEEFEVKEWKPEHISLASKTADEQKEYFTGPLGNDVFQCSPMPWVTYTHISHTNSGKKDIIIFPIEFGIISKS